MKGDEGYGGRGGGGEGACRVLEVKGSGVKRPEMRSPTGEESCE